MVGPASASRGTTRSHPFRAHGPSGQRPISTPDRAPTRRSKSPLGSFEERRVARPAPSRCQCNVKIWCHLRVIPKGQHRDPEGTRQSIPPLPARMVDRGPNWPSTSPDPSYQCRASRRARAARSAPRSLRDRPAPRSDPDAAPGFRRWLPPRGPASDRAPRRTRR